MELESFVCSFDKHSASEGHEQYSNAVMTFDSTPTSALTWMGDLGRNDTWWRARGPRRIKKYHEHQNLNQNVKGGNEEGRKEVRLNGLFTCEKNGLFTCEKPDTRESLSQ